METIVTVANIEDKIRIKNLLQLYLYELSSFQHIEMNENAQFIYSYLDSYWEDPSRFPYLVFSSGSLAGFALIRRIEDTFSVAEFFVLKKFRRKKIGLAALEQILKKHQGLWEISCTQNNDQAILFWKNVIRSYFDPDAKTRSFTHEGSEWTQIHCKTKF